MLKNLQSAAFNLR